MLPVSHVSQRYWLHILLFVATLGATVYAGVDLAGRWLIYSRPDGTLPAIFDGLRYSLSLLFFLTVHEFGHYFAARDHGVEVTLPYYIPSPFFFVPFNIGTFGAVIRIRDQVPNSKKLFDIGVAGPIAGFVAALVVLAIGLATMPDASCSSRPGSGVGVGVGVGIAVGVGVGRAVGVGVETGGTSALIVTWSSYTPS